MDASVLVATSSSVWSKGEPPSEPRLSRLLSMHDDPMRWEAPPMFDRAAAVRAFRLFVSHLEERLGQRFDYEAGSSIGEASFHGELYLYGGALRFSNFGNLVAFASDDDVPARLASAVTSLVREHGYVLVPEDELDRPYTGRNPHVPAGATWRERYFEAR